MKRLYPIKTHSPYIPGVVGKDIKLTFRERLAILFSGGIQITLVGDKNWAEHIANEFGDKVKTSYHPTKSELQIRNYCRENTGNIKIKKEQSDDRAE